jgi:hypothetical protein
MHLLASSNAKQMRPITLLMSYEQVRSRCQKTMNGLVLSKMTSISLIQICLSERLISSTTLVRITSLLRKCEPVCWRESLSISRAIQPDGMYKFKQLSRYSSQQNHWDGVVSRTKLKLFNRYVLSPTHLHEFKSADKNQAPIMSLYLPEQKLGSHSTFGASSNKFMLKGRQTGAMHRGHSWVFRAESYETMLAWVSRPLFPSTKCISQFSACAMMKSRARQPKQDCHVEY